MPLSTFTPPSLDTLEDDSKPSFTPPPLDSEEVGSISPDLERNIQLQEQAQKVKEMGGDIEPTTEFTKSTGGGISGLVPAAISSVQNKVIEPIASKIINAEMNPFGLKKIPNVEEGKSIIPEKLLPLSKEKGVIPALTRTFQGLTTPGSILTVPLAVESKLVQAGYLGGALSSIPESIDQLAQAKTPEEERDAATQLGISVAMAALMRRGISESTKPTTESEAKNAIRQQETTGSNGDSGTQPVEAVQSEQGTTENVPPTTPRLRSNQAKEPSPIQASEEAQTKPEQSVFGDVKTPPIEPQAQETAVPSEVKLPDWAREAMVRAGLDPKRQFNDIDLQNPSVREAIQSDPSLTEPQKASLLKTGSMNKGGALEDLSPEQQAKSNSVKEQMASEVAKVKARQAEIDAAKEKGVPLPTPENSGTTGIAHRVSESEGMAAPRGEGIGAEESVQKGRELLSKGADPEKVVEDFNNDPEKRISANGIAVVRAHNEALKQNWKKVSDVFGENSPEEKAAWEAVKAWKAKIKPMQTEWSKQGMAQQGETEIDTGTFIGLREAYHDATGKEFTLEQAKKAKKLSSEAQKLDSEIATAKKNLFDQLQKEPEFVPKKKLSKKIIETLDKQAQEALKRIKSRAGRLSAGLDPVDLADHAIYGAAKIAKGAVKFADWSAEMIKDLGEYVKPHLKQIWGDSIAKLNGQEKVKQVWSAAKSYLDKGETDFDNIRHKIADEFGLSVKEVTELLAKPKGVKKITDEMYRKMAERRRITNQAKDWVANAKYPFWLRWLKNVPRAFFAAKVFGHGTVGMITHAGNQMFNPLAVNSYWTNFFRQFKLMGVHDRGIYHEKMMQDLIRDPNFIKAKRAGLANDPFKYQDDYQNQFIVKFFHKIGLMGNRGFDSLKLFRQDRFNQRWDALPDDLKTDEMAKLLADIGNHETGVVKSRMGGEAGNWILFAPKLEGSRWAFLIGDTAKASKILLNWKNESPEAKYYAKRELGQKALIAGTYFGSLVINQGFLSATGSDQKINFFNPRRGDWLSFKIAGHNLGIISPMMGAIRFLVNVARDSMANRSNFEKLQSSRYEAIAEDVGKYARTKFSPFFKTSTDIASQSDFMGRPLPFSNDKVPKFLKQQGIEKYTYPQYLETAVLPIPFEEALRETWKRQGMSEDKIDALLKAITVAAVMGGTGARLSEDIHENEKKK